MVFDIINISVLQYIIIKLIWMRFKFKTLLYEN